jgi:hypothetical protein
MAALPVTVKVPVATESTTVAAPSVALTVTAPVEELIEIDWKPFCDLTGPVKVVLAILILYMRFWYISLHVRQPGLSDIPDNPGIPLV